MPLAHPSVGLFCTLLAGAPAFTQPRWKIAADGAIEWDVRRGDVHQDQIEMSGRKISAIVTCGVREDGALTLTRQLLFPELRTLPNDAHANALTMPNWRAK